MMKRCLHIVALAALTGCASAADEATSLDRGPDVSRSGGGCTSQLECPAGAFCSQGTCVRIESPALERLFVELLPPEGTRYARTHIEQPASAMAALTLEEALIFEEVRVLDAEGAEIAARVTLASEDRIEGLEAGPSLLVRPERPARLALVPGEYSATVLPLETNRPGIHIQAWSIQEVGLQPRTEFALPANPPRLFGEVTLRTSQEKKLSGVRVRAFAIGSGLASSQSITDDAGRFELLLPSTPDTAYRVEAAPQDRALAWSYEQVVVLAELEDRDLRIPLDETADAARGVARLQVLGMGDTGPEPVVGAEVTLTASITPAFKVFRTSGTTDGRGVVAQRSALVEGGLELLAARYVVDIQPIQGSAYRRTRRIVDLSQIGPDTPIDKQIVLERRVPVSGVITGPSGRLVPNAQLEFESLTSGTVLSHASDLDGAFEVPLDPGAYLVQVTGELLPISFHLIEVPERETLAPDQDELPLPPISLPSGVTLSGQVVGSEGEPVAGTEVRFYTRVADRTVNVGVGTADALGRVQVLLPELPTDP